MGHHVAWMGGYIVIILHIECFEVGRFFFGQDIYLYFVPRGGS